MVEIELMTKFEMKLFLFGKINRKLCHFTETLPTSSTKETGNTISLCFRFAKVIE